MRWSRVPKPVRVFFLLGVTELVALVGVACGGERSFAETGPGLQVDDAGAQASPGATSGGTSASNASGGSTGGGTAAASGSGGSSSAAGGASGGDGGSTSSGDPCGDGTLAADEECDDQNRDNGDGCTNACRVELGWECNPSAPSVCEPICGDGRIVGAEGAAGGCDDEEGDAPGCNSTCEVEAGYRCFGEPSACVLGCGDGEVSADEECDDGNDDPMDGCFACAQEDGYACDDMAGEPSTCADVDECDLGEHDCDANATCSNTTGGFTCACNAGYAGDGKDCGDVDECREAPCHTDAACTNLDGSYECQCKEGLGGDGEELCVDVSMARWPVPTDQSNADSYTRQTVAGDELVVDEVTGLVWQGQVPSAAFSWQEAVAHCRDLVLGDSRDWRLPMRVELAMLVDYSVSSGAKINGTAFPNTPVDRFWTGSRRAGSEADSWGVDFSNGLVQRYSHAEPHRVRCVRGASDPPAPRFEVDPGSSDVIYDRWTGLTWRNDSGGNAGQSAHADSCGTAYRLPTASELQTLVDDSRQPMAIYPIFDEVASGRHWTTTLFGAGVYISVALDTGETHTSGSTATIHAICVRSE